MKFNLLLTMLLTYSGCFLLGEDDGLKRCQMDWECGPMYKCSNLGSEGAEQVCISRDPIEAGAMMGVYYNKKTKICMEKGHDFTGVRTKTHKMGDCEWKTKQCRRCLSDVPFEGNPTCKPKCE